MRHLKQRSFIMAASAALVLTVGMFSLPQSRANAEAEGTQAIGSPFAEAPQLVAAARERALAATTTLAPVTVAPTTAAPTTLPPTTLPPTTLPPTTLPPAPAPPAPAPAPAGVASASGACGGDLPTCCIMMRESHGNPGAVNPSSGASGKWQFMYGTWNHYMGYETAAAAPEWVQDAKARELWAGGAGASHWAGNGC